MNTFERVGGHNVDISGGRAWRGILPLLDTQPQPWEGGGIIRFGGTGGGGSKWHCTRGGGGGRTTTNAMQLREGEGQGKGDTENDRKILIVRFL